MTPTIKERAEAKSVSDMIAPHIIDNPIIDHDKKILIHVEIAIEVAERFAKQQLSLSEARVKELEDALEAFVNSCYTGCTKYELNKLRINAEKILK